MSFDLYNEDCFEVFSRLPDQCVDALITDPPYGTTQFPWDKSIDWLTFWSVISRICKDNAVIVLFAAQPFATDLINSNRRNFRYELIWHKTLAVGWLDAKRRPLRAHENILIFARHLHSGVYNPQMEMGHQPYVGRAKGERRPDSHYGRGRQFTMGSTMGARYPRSVLTFANRREPSLHPTQKPLALLEWLVKTYSHPGDVVFDPFMGSGTTGVACASTGRRFIGVEREKAYFEVAQTRLSDAVNPLTVVV